MSFDSDETLEAIGAKPPSLGDPSALALEEARTTFEYQVQRLREIDNKAIEILKANLLIIGVFVTALSVLGQTELDVAAFVNVHTTFGGVLLLVSTALAGVTYTASNLRGGLDRAALESSLADGEAFESTLVRSYGSWIDHNAEVTAINDVLVTVTVLLVIDAFVYVVVGIVVGTLAPPLVAVVASFVVLTVVLTLLTWLAYHMDGVGVTGSSAGDVRTFDGVRLSKGASRRQGHDALRRMLWPSDDD